MPNNKEKPLSPELRTEQRTCTKCNKDYTINTINPEEDLSKYPSICPACSDPNFAEKMKMIKENMDKKDI